MNSPKDLITLGYHDPIVLKLVKERLNILGFGPLTPEIANYGVTTMEAVKRFQKANKLVADGIIGQLTWERLFDVKDNTVTVSDYELAVIATAKSQLHVREKTGHNDGVDVEQYLKGVDLTKGYAWCMAFVYWVFSTTSKEKGVPIKVPRTAGVMDCLYRVKKFANSYGVVTSTKPTVGSQFIMDFGKGTGHTGIVTALRGDRVYTIEGNTSADPSYAGEDREGNGVFERSRLISSIKAFIDYA